MSVTTPLDDPARRNGNLRGVDTPLTPQERLQVLKKNLETVADLSRELGNPAADLARIGDASIHIGLKPSEAEALNNYLFHEGESTDCDNLGRLIAETAALRFKIAEDVKDLQMAQGVDPELEGKVRTTLDLDIGMAEGISAEYGQLIQHSLSEGDRDFSLRLGELKLWVRQDIARARHALNGASPEDVRGLEPRMDDGLVESKPEETPEALPGDALAASQKRVEELKAKRRKEEKWRRQQKRLKILLGSLGLAAAFGVGQLILYLVPALQGPEMIIVTIADFSKVPVVASVDARPPSLFVKVHDHEWFQLDEQHQYASLHRIALILKQADYNGAKLRDSRGNLVAEWIRGVGEYVYDFAPPEPTTEPVEEPDPGRQSHT